MLLKGDRLQKSETLPIGDEVILIRTLHSYAFSSHAFCCLPVKCDWRVKNYEEGYITIWLNLALRKPSADDIGYKNIHDLACQFRSPGRKEAQEI